MRHAPLRRLALAASTALVLASAGCTGGQPVPTTTTPGATAPGATTPGATASSAPGARGTGRPAARPTGKDERDIPAGPAVAGAAGETGEAGKLLLAIYMIGSDLEDDVVEPKESPDEVDAGGQLNPNGAATADLLEIAEAVKAMTPAQRANVDVLVLFGGARQTGWKGTKLMNLEGLLADAEDGYFGNAPADTYLADAPGADMGDPAVFEGFIGEVQARRGDAKKLFLDIWDHGGSFAGMGPDTNTEGILANDEIEATLGKKDFRADFIGFDACLMGSLEVIKSVHKHAAYLVASEETEPGHGWDYTLWLSQVAARPEASNTEIGKWLVDGFLDSEKHKVTNGRTLSLINLEKAEALLAAGDALGRTLSENVAAAIAAGNSTAVDPILDAHRGATRFGSHGADDDEFGRDLHMFADALAKQNPALAADAAAVKAAVEGCVVYAREDGTKPGARGISIYSFTNPTYFRNESYNERTASGPGWHGFIKAMADAAGGDQTPPTVTEEAVEGYRLHQQGDAFRLKVEDALGIEEVSVLHVVQPDPAKNVFHIVGQEGADEVEENTFGLPAWDGQTLHLTGADGAKSAVPFDLEAEDEGFLVLAADCTWNGETATLRLVFSPEGAIVNTWVTPYETDEQGDVQIAREQYELQDGDTLAFIRPVMDVDADDLRLETGAVITYDADAAWSWEKVAGTAFYFGMAEDLKGNLQNSPVHAVE